MIRFAQRLGVFAAGLAITLLLVEGGLRLAGWVFTHAQEERNRKAIEEGGDTVILCIGESTTAHGADVGLDNAYPALLGELLNRRAGERRFTVVNRGIPGADSSVLLERLEANLEELDPQIVVAMMGANDKRFGAIPVDGVPQARKKGFPYSLKTYKLVTQLIHDARRERRPAGADTLSPETENWPPPPLLLPEDGLISPFDLLLTPRGALEEITAPRPSICEEEIPRADEDTAEPDPFLLEKEREYLQKLEASPLDPDIHFRLGVAQFLLGDLDRGAARFQRAATLGPRTSLYRLELGVARWLQGRYAEAEREVRAAVVLAPGEPFTLVLLAEILRRGDRPDEAQEVLYSALANLPSSGFCHNRHCIGEFFEAVSYYFQRPGADAGLEKLLLEACRLHRASPWAPARLARYLRERGRHDEAARYLAMAQQRQASLGNKMSRESYARLKEVCDERGIQLIAVQYPGRPLDSLVETFEDSKGVIFVDNEKTFQDALATMPYDDLFGDHCYGDFGHATKKGNLLLAENIARAIAGLMPAELREKLLQE